MTTIRLDAKTEMALKRLSKRRGQTGAEVVREAVARLAEEEKSVLSAFDRLRPFIGVIEGGDPNLSKETGKRVRELLEKKQSARRSG
jgi:predicted DNA-binding protein